MTEARIENYLVREVQKCGGLCYKFTSPGSPAYPTGLLYCRAAGFGLWS
jgi:hypothetical protein